MTHGVTLRKVGDATGFTVPKALLDRYGLEPGSRVFVTDTPDGILVSVHDPEMTEAMEIYEDVAERYKNALRDLAT